MMTRPSARSSAVSTDSVRRCCDEGLTARRSTTTSIVCFFCLASLGGSSASMCDLAVDDGAAEALRLQLAEQLEVLALAAADDRREHLEAGALVAVQDAVDDLLRRLAGDRLAARGAVRTADPGVEQAQVVVDLGDRADGRARVARGGLLVDRDRRRQTLDEVDVRLVHLAEELPGVRRERLDVAALALGEDGVERERRLAGAGQTREDDERVPRQVEGDVLEVVLACAADEQSVCHVISLPGGRAIGTSGRGSPPGQGSTHLFHRSDGT